MNNFDLAARAYDALCAEHADKLAAASKALQAPALCPFCLNAVGLTSHSLNMREHKLAPNGRICAGSYKAPVIAMQAALDQPAAVQAQPLYKRTAAPSAPAVAVAAKYERAYEALAAEYADKLAAAAVPSAVCVFCRAVVPLYRGKLKAHRRTFHPFCDGEGKTPAEAVRFAVALGRFELPAEPLAELPAPAPVVEAPAPAPVELVEVAPLVEAPAPVVEVAPLVEAPAPVSITPTLERLAQINAEADALRAQLLARRALLVAELAAIDAALAR